MIWLEKKYKGVMTMTIRIKDFTDNALSENSGTVLRSKIIELQSKNVEEIKLDFSGITLFTTMFFNASIGFFIINGKKDLIDKIELLNITQLGKRTYQHSYDNAVYILNNSAKKEEINKIINDGIENS